MVASSTNLQITMTMYSMCQAISLKALSGESYGRFFFSVVIAAAAAAVAVTDVVVVVIVPIGTTNEAKQITLHKPNHCLQ